MSRNADWYNVLVCIALQKMRMFNPQVRLLYAPSITPVDQEFLVLFNHPHHH